VASPKQSIISINASVSIAAVVIPTNLQDIYAMFLH
jgi:hypothetical protein